MKDNWFMSKVGTPFRKLKSASGKRGNGDFLAFDPTLMYHRNKDMMVKAAISLIKSHNLPKTVDTLYMENLSLVYGTTVVFVPEIAPELLLSGRWVNKTSKRSFYGRPRNIRALTSSPQFTTVRTKDFVIGYDSVLSYNGAVAYPNLLATIRCFARELTIIDIIAQLNLVQQHKPYLINVDKNITLSDANIWEQFQDFRPYIAIQKGKITDEEMKTLDLKVPYIGNDLMEHRERVWANAMYAIGYAPGTTKMERQITDEVVANRQSDSAMLQARLAAREDFMDRINAKFKGRVFDGEVFKGDAFVTLRSDPYTMQEVAAIFDEGKEAE